MSEYVIKCEDGFYFESTKVKAYEPSQFEITTTSKLTKAKRYYSDDEALSRAISLTRLTGFLFRVVEVKA